MTIACDAIDGQRPPENGRHASGRRERVLTGVIVSFLVAIFLVFAVGLGVPSTYWLQVGEMQVFEGPEGVVLFVEVDRTVRLPGFVRSVPVRKKPLQLLRIDVSRTGQVTRNTLRFNNWTTFNTNIAPIVRLEDDFYLVQEPSLGHPDCQLHRVNGKDIVPLSLAESRALLRSVQLICGPLGLGELARLDTVSNANGWWRLNGASYAFRRDPEGYTSRRHKLRIRFTEADLTESVVAESLAENNHWITPAVAVITRRWKSYRSLVY